MKKIVAILLGCMLVASAYAATPAKKSTKSSAKKTTKTVKKKSSANEVTLKKGTYFVNTNLTNIGLNAMSIGPSGGKQSVTRFGFQGNGGYAIENDLAIFGGVGFQYAKLGETKAMAVDLNGGLRYYFVPNFYCGGGLGIAFCNVKNAAAAKGMAGGAGNLDDDDDDDFGGADIDMGGTTKGHSISLTLCVGYSHWLTKKIAIEPSLGYSIGLSNKMAGMKVNMSGLSINCGFTILL